MGLDLLDIHYRMEKAFGIRLSPEDFQGLVRDGDVTVGDLYHFILRKLQLHDVARYDVGLNHHLWTEMQAVVQAVTEAPPEQIELKTPLESLFPKATRRERWAALRSESSYRIRELDYPKAVRRFGFALSVGMVLVEQFRIWQIPGAMWLWPVLGIIGVWMVGETYLKVLSICAPLRTRFPSGMRIVKDLCRDVLAAHYEDLCRETRIPLDDRCLVVWQQLREILVDALGVKPDEVTFRARLIRDLGMS